MSSVYITEYYILADLPGDAGQMCLEPPIAEQVVPIGAAAQSAVLNSATRFVRINVDAACSILFGCTTDGSDPNPAAVVSTSNQRFARDQTEFKGIPPRGKCRIAAISNT